MEVFKCDPCSKSNTGKDKNERVLATSFAIYLILLLSKPLLNSDTSYAISIRDEIGNKKWAKQLSPSLSEVRETTDILIDSTADVCLQNPKSVVSNLFAQQ